VLEFKGRRRQQWAPGRLTELFFLDEATGLAAGHRPCGECRYQGWTPGGYRGLRPDLPADPVTVITPRATVAVLAAGYRPVVHPSAEQV
jgi:hypothetical protein